VERCCFAPAENPLAGFNFYEHIVRMGQTHRGNLKHVPEGDVKFEYLNIRDLDTTMSLVWDINCYTFQAHVMIGQLFYINFTEYTSWGMTIQEKKTAVLCKTPVGLDVPGFCTAWRVGRPLQRVSMVTEKGSVSPEPPIPGNSP
jgi:hypothetical protein